MSILSNMMNYKPRPFGGIKPPEGPEYQDAMDSWNEAMGNDPKMERPEELEPEEVVRDRPLWNGIKPPDWAPEETQQAWRDSIGQPMQPGQPRSLTSTLGASQPAGAGGAGGAAQASTRRGIEKKRSLLTGAR